MKQLTMTKVLTPLAALAFAFGVQAAAVSTSGFETSEGYTANASPTNNASAGWSFTPGSDGADDESAVTTYTSAGIATPATCPDGTTAGSNFLKLSTEDGMLFRKMDPSAQDGAVAFDSSALFVDTDVQFTITDHSDQPEVTADDKFIIWLEDNNGSTNLCAWAGCYDSEGTLSSNVFSLVDSAESDKVTITPNSWHRLTVKAISNVNAGGSITIPGFQVYVDGHLFRTTDTVVHDDYIQNLGSEAQTLVGAMTILPAMKSSMTALSQIGFSGEGSVDNVVVTKDIPGFLPHHKVAISWGAAVNAVTLLDANDTEVTTLTNSGDYVVVGPDVALHFDKDSLGFVNNDGDYYDFTDPAIDDVNWNVDGNVAPTLVNGVITIPAANGDGSFTIALSQNSACTLTLTATGFSEESPIDAFDSITYAIGAGSPVSLTEEDLDNLAGGLEIACAIGDTITFTVNPKVQYSATLSGTGGTMSGSEFTVGANQHSAAVEISLSAAPAKVKIGDTPYYTLAAALNAATVGQTVTLQMDVDGDATLSTAAGTLDLNGYTITGTKTGVTFTGSGAKTLKGGEITATGSGSLNTLTVTVPAGSDLTIEDMTFHSTVCPKGGSSASLVLVTNCTFKCDLSVDGAANTGNGETVHSYGVLLDSGAAWPQADVVNNWFAQGRRAAIQADFDGDLYFYGNTVDATLRTVANSDGLSAAYPALQIFSNGRVFIENNTFFGQYLGEAFCMYAKGAYRFTTEPVVFNGNTVSNGVQHLWGVYDVDATGVVAVVEANVLFGANDIGNSIDLTKCVYKATQDDAPYGPTPATLALPTGVATVYAWTHAAGAVLPYDVSGTGATSLTDGVANGDVIIAVPGAAAPVNDTPAGVTYTADSQYKNKWTAASTPSGETIAPGGQSSATYDSQADATAAIANVTITPAAAIETALGSEGATNYATNFEAKVVAAEGGKFKIEVALKESVEDYLQAQANADAAEVIDDLSQSDVTLQTTPGFYYSFEYGTTLGGMSEGARTLATGSTLTLPRPTSSGATAGFYKVLVNITDK